MSAEHKGKPEECEACKQSDRPECPNCGHKLTNYWTDDGRTVCPFCGERHWFGVGEYND